MTHASKLYALLCNAYGAPPHIETVALPTQPPLEKDEVRLQVQYAAFNFTDHLLVQGRYQDKPNVPFVPGLDAAGIVLEAGENVKQFQPGDSVVSSGVVGAWASQLTAPAHRLVPVPNGLDPALAVASINSHLTAYHGLVDRAQLKAGERVLVLGANGAVGKACVQIAEHFGAGTITVERHTADHTAGAHGPLAMVLRHGGTLYLDDGKPVPKLIDRTVANLRKIQPNVMINVPRGLDMLVAAMEETPKAAKDIFANLQIIVYGGAALGAQTLLKLEQLSAQATGKRIPISASLGSTETTMPATLIWWPPELLGTLGLPAPGVEAKLLPVDDRYEVRFRGPSITPGYFKAPQANEKSFDEDGFLKTGDAVQFVNINNPAQGLIYAGRMSENFKLTSGTWVSVATVRGHLLPQLHPFVSDAVLTGHNAAQLGALLFLNTHQIRKRFPELQNATDRELTTYAPLLEQLTEGIKRHNQNYPGSSTRICRALLLDSPPNIDENEITDKGYINQSGVLKRRGDAVKRLYECQESAGDCLVCE